MRIFFSLLLLKFFVLVLDSFILCNGEEIFQIEIFRWPITFMSLDVLIFLKFSVIIYSNKLILFSFSSPSETPIMQTYFFWWCLLWAFLLPFHFFFPFSSSNCITSIDQSSSLLTLSSASLSLLLKSSIEFLSSVVLSFISQFLLGSFQCFILELLI